MNVTLRPKIMSIEDFLAWESRQERRWEYNGFEPVEMVGGPLRHALIQSNLIVALRASLLGNSHLVLGSDMKVVLPGSVRYPDAQVVATGVTPDATFMTAPLAVFEVVSPSSRVVGYEAKVDEYCCLPSLRDYAIIEQDRPDVTHHFRTLGGAWAMRKLIGLESELLLDTLAVPVPLSAIYENVLTA